MRRDSAGDIIDETTRDYYVYGGPESHSINVIYSESMGHDGKKAIVSTLRDHHGINKLVDFFLERDESINQQK
jgi:hypothetical protein